MSPQQQSASPEQVARLLPQLLAPVFRIRRAADSLLFAVTMREPSVGGRWTGGLARGFELLGRGRDEFLHALISFWAGRMSRQYEARMSNWGARARAQGDARWSHAAEARYPVSGDELRGPAELYGGNIARWLGGIGPAGAACLDQLVTCLDHPEPMVSSCAVIPALGSMGPAAVPAVPRLLERVRMLGVDSQPFHLGIALARILADDSDAATRITAEIDPTGPSEAFYGLCWLLEEIARPSPAASDLMLEKLRDAPPDRVSGVLWIGSGLARRSGSTRSQAWRDQALRPCHDPDDTVRAAAAHALGQVGVPESDTAPLVELAGDPAWKVRAQAYRAAKEWRAPAPELVRAMGRDLQSDDDDATEAALQGLDSLGSRVAPALDSIRTWIDQGVARLGSGGPDERFVFSVLGLIESPGDDAQPLRPSLARLHEILRAERLTALEATRRDADSKPPPPPEEPTDAELLAEEIGLILAPLVHDEGEMERAARLLQQLRP
ncbi:MAG TPA: HEAT repeat domain-containing protein [Myxococcota bacterium]|nr:HEAT repeat domain-containing protein [Myxococcota bacterium]